MEAVQVTYDPKRSLIRHFGLFLGHIDPTDPGGQFVDRGPQYRAVIYYHDEEQRRRRRNPKGAASSRAFRKPSPPRSSNSQIFTGGGLPPGLRPQKNRCATNITAGIPVGTSF